MKTNKMASDKTLLLATSATLAYILQLNDQPQVAYQLLFGAAGISHFHL